MFISNGAGVVSIHAIQQAKSMFGASVVATTASAPKADFVRTYGADKVVDYKSEDAGEVLKDWADVAFDCTGEPDMAAKVVKGGGKMRSIVVFGNESCSFLMLQASGKLMQRIANAVESG